MFVLFCFVFPPVVGRQAAWLLCLFCFVLVAGILAWLHLGQCAGRNVAWQLGYVRGLATYEVF